MEEYAEVGVLVVVGHAESIVARRKATGCEGDRAVGGGSGKSANGHEMARIGTRDKLNEDRAIGTDPLESVGLALDQFEIHVGDGGLRKTKGRKGTDDGDGELHGDRCEKSAEMRYSTMYKWRVGYAGAEDVSVVLG